MSWARGVLNGREVGYAVEAECDLPSCTAEIDRGLAFRCGDTDFNDERGCGGYFCYVHLLMTEVGQLCPNCAAKLDPCSPPDPSI